MNDRTKLLLEVETELQVLVDQCAEKEALAGDGSLDHTTAVFLQSLITKIQAKKKKRNSGSGDPA